MNNSPDSQRWYVAILVMASRLPGDRSAAPAVELQHRLVRALDDEQAYSRALELGRNEAHSYQNEQGQSVVWEFVGLHDLCEINSSELVDGTELYGHIVRENPASLLVTKELLSCFWFAANGHRAADDILDNGSTT